MRFVWIMMLGLPGIAAGEAVAPAFDDVRDILERNCVECHTQEKAKADLIMTTREAMVTGGSLAGFRAEAPANVCVVVRAHDADAAREALAAVRPAIDDTEVGDDSPTDTQVPQGRIIDSMFPAVLLLGAVTTLGLLGWRLAGLPGFEASPLDFVVAFGMLALLWLVWQKRRT
jgi:hypothetical protein